jgi:hypothetical protein
VLCAAMEGYHVDVAGCRHNNRRERRRCGQHRQARAIVQRELRRRAVHRVLCATVHGQLLVLCWRR